MERSCLLLKVPCCVSNPWFHLENNVVSVCLPDIENTLATPGGLRCVYPLQLFYETSMLGFMWVHQGKSCLCCHLPSPAHEVWLCPRPVNHHTRPYWHFCEFVTPSFPSSSLPVNYNGYTKNIFSLPLFFYAPPAIPPLILFSNNCT